MFHLVPTFLLVFAPFLLFSPIGTHLMRKKRTKVLENDATETHNEDRDEEKVMENDEKVMNKLLSDEK